MEKKLRLRSPNFTYDECLLLCDIISKYKTIIENKKFDGAHLKQKREAWIKVMKDFNLLTSGHQRTVESLQMCYKKLKIKAKRDASGAQIDILELGPPPKCNDDALLEKVQSLVVSTIDGEYNIIYSEDSSLINNQNIDPIETNGTDSENEMQSIKNSPQTDEESQDAIATSPKTHVTPVAPPNCCTNDRTNLKRKLSDLLTSKSKLCSEEQEKQSDDFQRELLKIQLIEEQEKLEHNRLLRAMELEDVRKKYAHNEKLRKLELEKTILIKHIRN